MLGCAPSGAEAFACLRAGPCWDTDERSILGQFAIDLKFSVDVPIEETGIAGRGREELVR